MDVFGFKSMFAYPMFEPNEGHVHSSLGLLSGNFAASLGG
jgi:hypothetical protein